MYTTVAKIKEYMDVGEMSDAMIESIIRGVSRQMDQMANRKLVVDELGSGDEQAFRYYDNSSHSKIFTDDFWDIEKVEIGDASGLNLVEATDYSVYPLTAPHKAIILNSFSTGGDSIKITGEFGFFRELPADIELACIILVAGVILNQTMISGGTVSVVQGAVKSESIGNYSVTYETGGSSSSVTSFNSYSHALDIINSYRRILF